MIASIFFYLFVIILGPKTIPLCSLQDLSCIEQSQSKSYIYVHIASFYVNALDLRLQFQAKQLNYTCLDYHAFRVLNWKLLNRDYEQSRFKSGCYAQLHFSHLVKIHRA